MTEHETAEGRKFTFTNSKKKKYRKVLIDFDGGFYEHFEPIRNDEDG